MSVGAWLAIGGGLVLAGPLGTGLSAAPSTTASTLAASMHGDPLALAPALVTKTIARTSAVLVEVRTDDGEVVLSTPEHPFALARSQGRDRPGWARADRLAAGDDLLRLSPGGPTAEVTSVRARQGRPVPVFNLVVSRIHAYAVGSDHLLVHNGKCKTPDELAADRQRLEDLVAERARLKKDGDPEHKLTEIGKEIRRMKGRASRLLKRSRIRADPAHHEAYRENERRRSALRAAEAKEADTPARRERLKQLRERAKARYQEDAEFRERDKQRKVQRYWSDENYRRRENQRSRDRARRLAIIASLDKDIASSDRDKSLAGISTGAIDAEVRELEALLRGPGESAELDTTELRRAVDEDFGDLERQLESGAGGEAATTSNLERDFGLEEQTFAESLAEVHDRISAYDSMSEEVAACFPGLREELVAEERNLVNRRCAQLQSEMEVTHHQLMLMRDIPEFHDAAAEGALEHQLQTLTAELGTLTGAPL